ncbi:glycosyltransferase family 1 protein [soil metagenome]
MHIAYFTETYPPELNGVALTVHRTVQFLRDQGNEVDLIRPRQPGEAEVDEPGELRTAGLPIPMYPDLRFGLARVSTLRKRLQAFKPRLVHIATQGPLGWAGARAARSLGIPVTTDFRTNFHQYGRYYGLGFLAPATRAYLRGFHNAAQATFVPTRELQASLASFGFENLHVVGRGVDTSRFDPALRDAALRAEWGVAEPGDVGAAEVATVAQPVVLYVGRLAAEKNVPLLFRAIDAARATHAGLKVVVVGDGPLRAELQVKHPDAVFLGALRGEALARCFASADLFAFPSMSETFGNVVVEALASGLVVVAFATAAAGELISDGVSGLVVKPDDDDAFVAATSVAIDNFYLPERTSQVASMRDAARAVALATGWDAILRRFEEHLQRVADAGSPRPHR